VGETPREKWAGYFGAFMTVIPALIVSGFMPEWNVLPFSAWLAIATAGAGIAGAIATPRTLRGAVAGALVGAGVLVGVVAYVEISAELTSRHTFWSLEIAIGALLGGLPGGLLYMKWARGAALAQAT
jgi:hypothetical protein